MDLINFLYDLINFCMYKASPHKIIASYNIIILSIKAHVYPSMATVEPLIKDLRRRRHLNLSSKDTSLGPCPYFNLRKEDSLSIRDKVASCIAPAHS